MKSLEKIVEKYSKKVFNANNYSIGGGLSEEAFASRRHQEAKYDQGKLTVGQAAKLFKTATGLETNFIHKIFESAIPNMEWHHAGKLPKKYGGGMKKTYFLNAREIVEIASNWNLFIDKIEESKKQAELQIIEKKEKDLLKEEFLNTNARKIIRIRREQLPDFFYETNKEMEGKFGWFSSYGKYYNMTEYHTGWAFENQEKYHEFFKL